MIYDLTKTTFQKLNTGDVLNIPYSGQAIAATIPAGKYTLEVWGAQGGYRTDSSKGGKGGYSKGTITLQNPQLVYIYSGGSGNSQTASGSSSVLTLGGFNGGGGRYRYYGGGGGSDIRIGTDSLYARVIVAGGGGSDGATSKTGMYGGGTSGGSSTESYGTGGGGGTQTEGGTGGSSNSGSFGMGGNGLYRSSGYGGAGGGGWYGGGGSYPDSSSDDDRGGGGGSGYVYTASNVANYPSGCLLNSNYYLTDTQIIAGNASFTDSDGQTVTGHEGNGYARITATEVFPTVPDAPKNLRVTTKEYFTLSITWNAVESTGYKVYKNGKLVSTQTKTTYTDSTIQPNETHLYEVAAYNSEGESERASLNVNTLYAYVADTVKITSAAISPTTVNTGGSFKISVSVTESVEILYPEWYFSGEIYTGES